MSTSEHDGQGLRGLRSHSRLDYISGPHHWLSFPNILASLSLRSEFWGESPPGGSAGVYSWRQNTSQMSMQVTGTSVEGRLRDCKVKRG